MEKDAWHIHGLLAIVILAVLAMIGVFSLYENEILIGIICFGLFFVLATGLAVVQPNQALIVEWFGKYVGTYRHAGMVLVYPFATKRKVSLRIRRHKWEPTDSVSKTAGGCFTVLVLYKIVDAAKVTYEIEQLESYLNGQIELVLYDCITAQDDVEEAAAETARTVEMKTELQNKLHKAGIALMDIQVQQMTENPFSEQRFLTWMRQLLKTFEKEQKQIP